MPAPEAAGGRQGAPAPGGGQLLMLMVLFFAAMLLLTPQTRVLIGSAVGVAFYPLIGFGGAYPVITLLIAGTLMVFFSTIARHFFVDWVEQARNQRYASAFNKEFRKARLENNMYKIKKLTEVQKEVMAKSMSGMQTQMKLMPVTMVVAIPIFAWLAYFVYDQLPSTLFSSPWYWNADLLGSNLLPNWILLEIILALPFGQLLSRVLRYFSFRKRLQELDGGRGAFNAG